MTRYSSARKRAMRIAVQRGDAMRERAAMCERLARFAVMCGAVIMAALIFYTATA